MEINGLLLIDYLELTCLPYYCRCLYSNAGWRLYNIIIQPHII